jgi:hypothetical protein
MAICIAWKIRMAGVDDADPRTAARGGTSRRDGVTRTGDGAAENVDAGAEVADAARSEGADGARGRVHVMGGAEVLRGPRRDAAITGGQTRCYLVSRGFPISL